MKTSPPVVPAPNTVVGLNVTGRAVRSNSGTPPSVYSAISLPARGTTVMPDLLGQLGDQAVPRVHGIADIGSERGAAHDLLVGLLELGEEIVDPRDRARHAAIGLQADGLDRGGGLVQGIGQVRSGLDEGLRHRGAVGSIGILLERAVQRADPRRRGLVEFRIADRSGSASATPRARPSGWQSRRSSPASSSEEPDRWRERP